MKKHTAYNLSPYVSITVCLSVTITVLRGPPPPHPLKASSDFLKHRSPLSIDPAVAAGRVSLIAGERSANGCVGNV